MVISSEHDVEVMKVQLSSKNPRPMEVWSADIKFENSDGSKDRPVIILSRNGSSYDVMIVTTHPHNGSYVQLTDSYAAGLVGSSHVKADSIKKIPRDKLNYLIGELGDDDQEIIRSKYATLKKRGP